MGRKSAKCAGLADKVAGVVGKLSMSARFTTEQMVEKFREDLAEASSPSKSMARALGYLCKRGDVRLIQKVHPPGTPYAVAIFGRGTGRIKVTRAQPLLEEPSGTVKRTPLPNGNTLVQHGKAWKPYRESKAERPWRGYQSSLSAI